MKGMTSETAKLHIAIDLGGDTLKIAFGYKVNGKRRRVYGKLSYNENSDYIGIPAVAFFSNKYNKWFYGHEVDTCDDKDFTNVVYIKSLMLLLAKAEDEKMTEENKKKYESGNAFPKYRLPSERNAGNGFGKGETFTVDKTTPKTVCENFFMYVKYITDRGIKRLSKESGISFEEVDYSIVYPLRIGNNFVTEYERLVCKAFGIQKVSYSVSAVKSLGIYAYRNKAVEDKEKFLVFDIGEEYISVAKLWFVDENSPYIDGEGVHKKRERLGGIDIDSAVQNQLEDSLKNRDTFLSPPPGSPGHIEEVCVDSQKYRFLKDVKIAKHILSSRDSSAVEAKEDTVSLLLKRECFISKKLSRSDLESSIGISGDKNEHTIAAKITKYIVEETNDIVNKDVGKIFIAGGVAKTSGLCEYIRNALSNECNRTIELKTFDNVTSAFTTDLNINKNESSVYAAAVGAAMISVEEISIKTFFTFTYGNIVTDISRNIKRDCFMPIIYRGGELDPSCEKKTFVGEDELEFYIPRTEYTDIPLKRNGFILKPKFVSCILDEKDVERELYKGEKSPPAYSNGRLMLDNDENKKAAEKWFKLKELELDTEPQMSFYYKNQRVRVKYFDTAQNSNFHDVGFVYKRFIVSDSTGNDVECTMKILYVTKDRGSYKEIPPPQFLIQDESGNPLNKGRPVKLKDLQLDWMEKFKLYFETND